MEYLHDVDKTLIKSLKVTYITGKGNNHLVPVLMPEDTIPAFQCLANREVRRQAGVSETNNYLFSSTRDSQDHISVNPYLYLNRNEAMNSSMKSMVLSMTYISRDFDASKILAAQGIYEAFSDVN